MHPSLRTIVGGLSAILLWAVLYLFLAWYEHGGFFVFWVIWPTVVLLIFLLAKIKSRMTQGLLDRMESGLEVVFENYIQHMDWVATFILLCFGAVIIALLLLAPYGVLCHLGLKPCGAG